MELKNVIENRRSIRHFNDLNISKEEIEEILEAGINAPSAHNRQPWNFIVINKSAIKNEIATILLNKIGAQASLTCEVIKEAPTLILVFGTIENELMDSLSIGACIENMLLRATDLNIASLWIGYIVEINDELKKMFNKKETLVSAISLGHSDSIPNKRPRIAKEEKTEWR